jgi:ATP-dependent DNA helicase RecG
MGRSEELGTGLRNVYKYSKAYSGSEDLLFNEEDLFTVDVPLDKEMDFDRNVVEIDLKILGFLRKNNTRSAKSIAIKMDMTERTIQRYLETN